MRHSLLFVVLVLLVLPAAGQNGPIERITPFTGTDHVKIVAKIKDPSVLEGRSLEASIRSAGKGEVLWEGQVSPEVSEERGMHYLSFSIEGLSPVLWTPAKPFLYEISLQLMRGAHIESETSERLGFRMFESKSGQLYLNGKPIFLRGIAINPPGRGIPDSLERSREFAEDYVKFMKSIHVNIIRIPDDETWYDVCDEQGMMVFGGNYSGVVDGKKPPEDYDKAVFWYKEHKFSAISHHPSLMIYALTNEVAYRGVIAGKWKKFLSYAHTQLKEWDDTRLYIGNAGYGYGQSGDICDLHRYWGWYYSSPFTFLHIRDNAAIIPFEKGVQPITFTECVGNYSGPDGRYNLSPDHKNPGSQLNWTGHAARDMQALLANEHQSFTFRQATELSRRLRVINPELSGIFPFTIAFYNWHTIEKFMDMDPKPVTRQAKLSYQPVLLSWECWTPQVYAGSEIRPVVHIVNDDDQFRDLRGAQLVYQLQDQARSLLSSDTLDLPDIPYYDTYERKLSLELPPQLPTGTYLLKGKIIQDTVLISENHYELFIASPHMAASARKPGKNVVLYDPSGNTEQALEKLAVPFEKISSFSGISPSSFLVIGENAAGAALAKEAGSIKKFVKGGGRILCLRQDSLRWGNMNTILSYQVKNISMDLDIPAYPPPPRPSRNGYYVNPERTEHPVFSGIGRRELRVWSDYTGWDESKPGFPAIYPVTDGFIPADKEDIAHIAVLGNYGVALAALDLAEQFDGKGSVMLCGFDLVRRAGLDPVADRLLLNLLGYMGNREQHNRYPLITEPITWGDYASEKGVLTGIHSGLLLNSTPRLTGSYRKIPLLVTKEGHQFAGKPGGWNTRPGLQYIPYGRRPWGPYYLRGFGNIPEPLNPKTNTGEGAFWCSIPQGKTKAATLVWNPGTEPLLFSVSINGTGEASKEIQPGEKAVVTCPVNKQDIKVTFRGDRRLVILQTTFE